MKDLAAIKKLNSKKGVGQKLGRHSGKPTTKKKKPDELCTATVEALLKEAQEKYMGAHWIEEAEVWEMVVSWLAEKREG